MPERIFATSPMLAFTFSMRWSMDFVSLSMPRRSFSARAVEFRTSVFV
ncbi:MAG: hypothetical protein BWY99_01689 [Synergistetes bacterium ADurb.BinA166]|nr:MAG: hypothetical protein BWY99_01689 [Synergistetes bacterium ADurb.BinA166]